MMIQRSVILLLLGLVITKISANAQDTATVYSWHVSAKKVADKKYELTFSANGADYWQLYAPNESPGGVKTTQLVFADSSIHWQGEFSESGKTKSFVSHVFEKTTVKVYEGAAEWKTMIFIDSTVPAQLQGKLTYSYGKNDEFYTAEYFFSVLLEGGMASTTRILIPSIDIKNPLNNCGDEETAGKSLWSIFILGLLGGFIGLLTPCVFPLIPLTVSFFTKKVHSEKSGPGNAVLYGFFIFLIYILLSVPFHIFNATPEVLNNISTNIWINLTFFIIFLFFAFSFFGYYEINLPGGLANKLDSKSGVGNWGGIFFMALTLAVVSFSCTGPILGSLLVGAISNNGGPMQLTFGMAGFGLGLALPFAIFAMFPKWLHSLPKSGGWLTTVKVVLGFLELAMAIKFLSNADLVEQWGFLKREIFIAVWVIIGICIVLYLLGIIKFPHDTRGQKISKARWVFIVLFFAMTIYLVPGLTNSKSANLKLISGFPPPMCYSIYKEPVNCKKGFEPLRDYDQALTLAKKEHKPVLIDFTGWACVNCRRMEENVWTDPAVDSLMRTKFVVVSLYVDERRKLPLAQQLQYTTKKGDEKSIITVGDKWATFQYENFNKVSQPQYVIISTDEKALTKTKTYTRSPQNFADWLKCGLDAFEKNGNR
ncbi:MAG TPA: thioredoxin family protein [Chitinophagaceae bacterium]|nr:thioredoxin family protein [Chitinophagaceae bacterium]